MATRLNQIIAVEKGAKSASHSTASDLYKVIQKPDLFYGHQKVYQKQNEEFAEDLPPENLRVKFTVAGVLESLNRAVGDLLDITARKDWSNCIAKADVKIGSKVILKAVPVTYLLFLEKQLNDMKTFVETLPELDETHEWNLDQNTGLFKTPGVQTHRTKKVQKPIVLYDATEHHPAQTQLISEDVLVGYWNTVKVSGAISRTKKLGMAQKVEKLLRAVKEAREEANSMSEDISTPVVSNEIFEYVFSEGDKVE